jgi:hypothetical protein
MLGLVRVFMKSVGSARLRPLACVGTDHKKLMLPVHDGVNMQYD